MTDAHCGVKSQREVPVGAIARNRGLGNYRVGSLQRNDREPVVRERRRRLDLGVRDHPLHRLPLAERLQRLDHIQARRFSKLAGTVLEIATEGILRHLAACDRMDVNPDISAVREIIDDALNGRRVYAEAAEITRAA